MTLPAPSNPEILESKYPGVWPHVEAERIALYEGLGSTREEALEYELHTDSSQILLGECPMNATELGHRLTKEGYSPVLVIGVLDFDDNIPSTELESAAGAIEGTHFHTWLELPSVEDGLVVEVATEWPEAPGLPYISPQRPPQYHTPPNARFRFDGWMTHEIVGVPSRSEEFLDRATLVGGD